MTNEMNNLLYYGESTLKGRQPSGLQSKTRCPELPLLLGTWCYDHRRVQCIHLIMSEQGRREKTNSAQLRETLKVRIQTEQAGQELGLGS